jgi:hypothetical protein
MTASTRLALFLASVPLAVLALAAVIRVTVRAVFL